MTMVDKCYLTKLQIDDLLLYGRIIVDYTSIEEYGFIGSYKIELIVKEDKNEQI